MSHSPDQLHGETQENPVRPSEVQILPDPGYSSLDSPVNRANDDQIGFFQACSTGDLRTLRQSCDTLVLSEQDMSYALEQACHYFQIGVVRFLLSEKQVPLHTRCFQRELVVTKLSDRMKYVLQPHRNIIEMKEREEQLSGRRDVDPPPIQRILSSGSDRLYELLHVFLCEGGWHPDQLLSMPETRFSGFLPGYSSAFVYFQEVALHYPRCLHDLAILRMLLNSGADPTVARKVDPVCVKGQTTSTWPLSRGSGFILEMAANWGSPESIDLLIKHGARLDQGAALHSLSRCFLPNDTRIEPDAWHATADAWKMYYRKPRPDRFKMVSHLISIGEDIDAQKNV